MRKHILENLDSVLSYATRTLNASSELCTLPDLPILQGDIQTLHVSKGKKLEVSFHSDDGPLAEANRREITAWFNNLPNATVCSNYTRYVWEEDLLEVRYCVWSKND